MVLIMGQQVAGNAAGRGCAGRGMLGAGMLGGSVVYLGELEGPSAPALTELQPGVSCLFLEW